MIQVIIGSQNPVKIDSVKKGFEKMFPAETFSFQGLSTDSGVSDQPMTDSETVKGAHNRATNAKKMLPEADYWVGIEGGLDQTVSGLIAFAWVVILSEDQMGQSRTSTFHLPPKVSELVLGGLELGYANDRVFEETNSKQKGGAVGSLTRGVLSRTEYYVQPVTLALVPFLNPDLYPKQTDKR